MTGNELVQLPVGIRKRLAGGNTTNPGGTTTSNPSEQHTSITIGVIKVKLFTEYSKLDLFAKLEIDSLNTVLFLGASGVKLSHTGGIYGEARLNLLADVPVAQNGRKIQEFDYGKFGWIVDLDGNKIELWEPKDVAFL